MPPFWVGMFFFFWHLRYSLLKLTRCACETCNPCYNGFTAARREDVPQNLGMEEEFL